MTLGICEIVQSHGHTPQMLLAYILQRVLYCDILVAVLVPWSSPRVLKTFLLRLADTREQSREGGICWEPPFA